VEQTTIRSKLLSAPPSEWRVPAALQRLYADAAWLQQLVAEELRLSETEGKYVRNGFDH
jgi:hypothetical protein